VQNKSTILDKSLSNQSFFFMFHIRWYIEKREGNEFCNKHGGGAYERTIVGEEAILWGLSWLQGGTSKWA